MDGWLFSAIWVMHWCALTLPCGFNLVSPAAAFISFLRSGRLTLCTLHVLWVPLSLFALSRCTLTKPWEPLVPP